MKIGRPLMWVAAGLAAGVPLAMNPLGADAFSLPKLTALAIFCLLGLTLFVWDVFESSAIHFRAPILWKAVGIWLLWCFLKTYFSTNPSGSFWGLYLFQFNGLLEMFLYVIVLWMAMMIERWREVEIALFSAAALMCLYGIAQYFGMDPFPFKELGPGGRIWATMGNPNFFGMFIAMCAPLLFAFLLNPPQSPFAKGGGTPKGEAEGDEGHKFPPLKKGDEGGFIVKALGLILFLLLFTCLFLTRARGAWIAAAGGILVTAYLSLRAKRSNPIEASMRLPRAYALAMTQRGFLLAVLTCAVLAFLVSNVLSRLSLTATPKTASATVSERAASTVQFDGSGIQGRLSMWRTGLKLFKEKPLFGWGLDAAFSFNFRKFMEPRWESMTKLNAVPGYAHNEFLNVLCDLGLVGFGIYLWILFLFFRQAFSAGEFGALGAVSALLIQNLFSFSTLTGSMLFWMLLGRVYSREPLGEFPPPLQGRMKVGGRWMRRPALVLLGLAVAACAYFALRPLRADIHFQRGRGYITLGSWPHAVIEMEKAMNLWPYAWWQRELLGKGYLQISQQKHLKEEERFKLLNLSANNYQTFVKGWPQSAFGYNGLGVAYTYAAELSPKHKAHFLPNALIQFERAIEADPKFREVYSNFAQLLFAQGKTKEAFDVIQKGIERNPETASLHFMLGNFHAASGDMDLATENWKKAIEIEPNYTEAQARLSEALNR